MASGEYPDSDISYWDSNGNWVFHAGDSLTKTAYSILSRQLPEALQLFLDKNQGYGDMADVLGSRAQFVDMHRKMDKLKRALWEGQGIGQETVREVTMDLFGHVLLMLRTLDAESNQIEPGTVTGANLRDKWEA